MRCWKFPVTAGPSRTCTLPSRARWLIPVSRPSIEKYREAAGKRDRTLLNFINADYETMHLFMGYDGAKERNVCDAGFARAIDIINRYATLRSEPVCA